MGGLSCCYRTDSRRIYGWYRGGIGLAYEKHRECFFIFHHSNYSQVIEFATILRNAGFNPLLVEFRSTPQHDALLDEIYAKIGLSDFVICFPGLEPSFVEAEIAAAITGKKPIFIILPHLNRGAPNTSQKSYPTLILEKLRMEQFASIFAFLHYLYGDWRNTVKLLYVPININKSWPKLLNGGLV